MKASTHRTCGLLLVILLLLALPVRAQVAASVSADIGAVPADLVGPVRIDPALASETIKMRTLVNLWQQQGDLAAMRRILADPIKRAHAVGHFAEEDFVVGNPAWRKTAAANAPENDVWRWIRGRLKGGQIKTHANGDPAEYMRDMFKDTKAEHFFVPDDHMQPLVQKIQQQISKAETGGNERVAEIWRQQGISDFGLCRCQG
jgi:hypothetical protein